MAEWQAMSEVEALKHLRKGPPPIPVHTSVKAAVDDYQLTLSEEEILPGDTEDARLSNLRVSEPQIPWTRYFARMLDIALIGTAILSGTLIIASYYSPWLYLKIYTEDARVLLLFTLPLVMLVNGIIITIFGNSLGKKLFGIHAVNVQEERPFTLLENVAREFRVWARGLALGLPIINFFTMIPAYRSVAAGKPAQYDEGIASVRPYTDSTLRRTLGMIITAGVLITILTLNTMDAQNLRRVSQPYVWSNPVTGLSTTIPAGWEYEKVAGPDGGTLHAFTNLSTGLLGFFAVESLPQHTLITYADALETTLSQTMELTEWDRYDLPEVWWMNATMKEGNHPASIFLRRVDTRFWRLVYVDQLGAVSQGIVESPDLTRALFTSIGVD